jgi:hypothetical protein
MDDPSLTPELIDDLRQKQNKLYSMVSMDAIELLLADKLLRDCHSQYSQLLESRSRHYLMVYFLILAYNSSSLKPPALYDAVLESKSTPRKFQLPDPQLLSKLLPTVTQRELIDVITFSLLPAQCSYFLTAPGAELFVDLVNSSGKNKAFYARAAFFSPEFLELILLVFPPVIGNDLEGITSWRDELLSRWRSHIPRIPSVVVDLLSAAGREASALFFDSFFRVAFDLGGRRSLNAKKAKLLCLFDFCQTLGAGAKSQLHRLTDLASDTCIIPELVWVIQSAVPKIDLFDADHID